MVGNLIEVDPARWGRSAVTDQANCEVQFSGLSSSAQGTLTSPASTTYVFGPAGQVAVEANVAELSYPQPSSITDDPMWWETLSARPDAVLHRLVAFSGGSYLTACGKHFQPGLRPTVSVEGQLRCARCMARGWE